MSPLFPSRNRDQVRRPRTLGSKSKCAMESNDLEICCYTYIRRVKRREGKPQRFARAIRATGKSPFRRLGKHGIRKSSTVAQHHQRNRPLPGRFYVLTSESGIFTDARPRLINTLPSPEARAGNCQRSGYAGRVQSLLTHNRKDL